MKLIHINSRARRLTEEQIRKLVRDINRYQAGFPILDEMATEMSENGGKWRRYG